MITTKRRVTTMQSSTNNAVTNATTSFQLTLPTTSTASRTFGPTSDRPSQQHSASEANLAPALRGAGTLAPVDDIANRRLAAVHSAPLTAEYPSAERTPRDNASLVPLQLATAEAGRTGILARPGLVIPIRRPLSMSPLPTPPPTSPPPLQDRDA